MQKTSELIWQDRQHQELFHLIDQIKTNHLDDTVFARLNDYAEHHFALEEEYMAQLNYPGREEHLAAHNKFRRELAMMVDQSQDYNEALRESLSIFLREWLKRHVLGIDKKLERFIMESGQR